jgi:hypothetical protein
LGKSADLKQMTVRGLREKYEAVFGEPMRAGNKDFLFKRIAWRIQALAEGDLSERVPPPGTLRTRVYCGHPAWSTTPSRFASPRMKGWPPAGPDPRAAASEFQCLPVRSIVICL